MIDVYWAERSPESGGYKNIEPRGAIDYDERLEVPDITNMSRVDSIVIEHDTHFVSGVVRKISMTRQPDEAEFTVEDNQRAYVLSGLTEIEHTYGETDGVLLVYVHPGSSHLDSNLSSI